MIAVDSEYDIGLLRIENPRTETYVTFTADTLRPGTVVGAVGYHLLDIDKILAREAVPLLRFQGGFVSAVYGKGGPAAVRRHWYYETDVPMYEGASGCPGFLTDSKVFGMHVAEWHDGGTEEAPGQRAFSMWVPASAIISFAQKNKIEIPISS